MTTVQRSLEERIEKFEFSRKVCKTHISNYRNCVQQHGSHKMTNDNPCLNAWIMQNCCTGRVICPAAAEKAEQNTSGSHGELADCQQQFMTRLKADIAASKSRWVLKRSGIHHKMMMRRIFVYNYMWHHTCVMCTCTCGHTWCIFSSKNKFQTYISKGYNITSFFFPSLTWMSELTFRLHVH